MNLALLPARAELEQIVQRRDASYDGAFFVAVRTTGIFCRPTCPSRPKFENVEFFATIREALFAGYRPCQRCRPTEVYGTPDWVTTLLQTVEAAPERKLPAAVSGASACCWPWNEPERSLELNDIGMALALARRQLFRGTKIARQ